jgi:hypothetical protein
MKYVDFSTDNICPYATISCNLCAKSLNLLMMKGDAVYTRKGEPAERILSAIQKNK